MMNKLDELKILVDILKIPITALVFSLFGMVGYGFINMGELSFVDKIIISASVLLDIIVLIIIFVFIAYKVKEAKEK